MNYNKFTRMGKLPYGVPDKHILASQGGDSDLMKFYCTTNNTTYGRKWTSFEPRKGKHTGTGYSSNFRPVLSYKPRLDEIDNPAVGRLLVDNYDSVTNKSFRRYKAPNGTEAFPSDTFQNGSGYVREKAVTVPTKPDVYKNFIDTRLASAPADIMPRGHPYLHKIAPKDPVELENQGYGPGFMSTEYKTRYRGDKPNSSTQPGDVDLKSDGSGFVHNQNIEPITFNPDKAHEGSVPGWMTNRPTGVSIATTAYRPTAYPKGNEPLPHIAVPSDHASGFTNSLKPKPEFVSKNPADAYISAGSIPADRLEKTRKQDPCEYLNMTNPNNKSSVNAGMYRGLQNEPANEAARIGNVKVGDKEPTGFISNGDRYVYTADNPARFITHNQTRYLDRTPVGLDREGHVWGNVQRQLPDGFTRSTETHHNANGSPINTNHQLLHLEPYVGKSLKAHDQFFDDHTYDRKLHTTFARSMVIG